MAVRRGRVDLRHSERVLFGITGSNCLKGERQILRLHNQGNTPWGAEARWAVGWS